MLATSERKLLKELLLAVRNQKLCLIMTTGGGRGTPNNLVDQFRSNCETFCNMVIFNIPQSTQSEDVACCVKGKFSKATFIQHWLKNLSSKTSSLKITNYDLFFGSGTFGLIHCIKCLACPSCLCPRTPSLAEQLAEKMAKPKKGNSQ